MNKIICIFVGIVAMCINMANAITTAEIKDYCIKSHKFVWDYKNEICISNKPCVDKEFGQYCNDTFLHVRFSDTELAKKLIEAWLFNNGEDGGCDSMNFLGYQGRSFVDCRLLSGGYIQFEIGSIKETDSKEALKGRRAGACLAWLGTPAKKEGVPSIVCKGVSEKTCEFLRVYGYGKYDPDEKLCLPTND